MKNKILILNLEGQKNTALKQEKAFWTNSNSKFYWEKIFRKLNVDISRHDFFLIFKLDESFELITKKIDLTISGLYKNYITLKKDEIKIIITGDHDEISQPKKLKKREKIANDIKEYIQNSFNKDSKIILKVDGNFNIENIISEVYGKRINKSNKKENFGTNYPNLKDIKKKLDLKSDEFIKHITKKIKESSHPLFLAFLNED